MIPQKDSGVAVHPKEGARTLGELRPDFEILDTSTIQATIPSDAAGFSARASDSSRSQKPCRARKSS